MLIKKKHEQTGFLLVQLPVGHLPRNEPGDLMSSTVFVTSMNSKYAFLHHFFFSLNILESAQDDIEDSVNNDITKFSLSISCIGLFIFWNCVCLFLCSRER